MFSETLSINIKAKIHKSVILPLVLCGCETWSLTLREARRLKVFENGSEKDEVTGDWRRIHYEELYDLYSSTYIIRVTQLTH